MMSKRRIIIAMFVMTLGCLMLHKSVFADDVWIGNGEAGGCGGGGGYCSSSCENMTQGQQMTLLACTGFSWVFYETQLDETDVPQAIKIVPDVGKAETADDGDGHLIVTEDNRIEIPAECSAHGEGTGFWHFGRNAGGLGVNGSSSNPPHFNDYPFVNGYSYNILQPYTYSTLRGEWGHLETYNYSKYSVTYYSWTKYIERENLEHIIYANNRPIYVATRTSNLLCGENLVDCNGEGLSSGVSALRQNVRGGDVWEDFKLAYKAKYPNTDIDSAAGIAEMQAAFGQTYAFCYWPGMDEPEDPEPDPDYYAKSRVFVNNATEPSAVADTFENQGNSTRSADIHIMPGALGLTFKHNAYASVEAHDVRWKVQRVDGQIYEDQSGIDLAVENNDGLFQNGNNDSPVKTNTYSNLAGLDIAGTSKSYCEKLTVAPNDGPWSNVCMNVYVPYNFSNMPDISIGDTVYAGETVHIEEQEVTVIEKYNGLVGSEYATRVDNAKVRLVAYLANSGAYEINYQTSSSAGGDLDLCSDSLFTDRAVDGSCIILNESDGNTFNINNSPEWSEDAGLGDSFNVHDAPAGKYYCVALAVYPAESVETNHGLNANGNGMWRVTSQCAKILKRPSLRVLGGGIFATGEIDTPASEKKSLNGIYSYTPTSNEKSTAFGSWVEQSAVSYNYITGLASGASTGKTTIGGNEMYGSYEGSNLSYCDNRVPLSFANYGPVSGDLCSAMLNDGKTGKLYEGQGGPVSTDKSALIDFLTDGEVQGEEYEFNNGTNIQLENTSNYHVVKMSNGKLVRVTKGLGDLNISTANSIPRGVTHLVNAAGTVYINSNITYNNDSYSSLEEIPKLIIHGDNIVINCAVEQIDAILVSEHNIKTCTGDDVNDQAHAHRLLINGQLISNTFEPSRTYGAGVGAASGISAETINYDTSTILWARNMVDTEGSDVWNPVYQRILAPRF